MIQCERTDPNCEATATAVIEVSEGFRFAFCDDHATEELYDEGTQLIVDTPHDRIDDLEAELQETRALVEALRKRVKQLESDPTANVGDGVSDPRDAAVLEQLEVGDIVRGGDLRQLYKAETDVQNRDTLEKRVRNLKDRPQLVDRGYGRWEYVGNRGETDG